MNVLDGIPLAENPVHVLSVSGGKDSTAMYLLAMEEGIQFQAVFADTGNEHEITLDYIRKIPQLTGGPEIQWVKTDFAEDLERKKKIISTKWVNEGVDASKIDSALLILQPSGNPFLDCSKAHGRFPSTKVRFCSEELKRDPIYFQAHEPLMAAGHTVISWQGVRAEESSRRAGLPEADWPAENLCNYRPLLQWTLDDVVAIHRRHGIELNPLYQMGMRRVGCMPCIHSRKNEIKIIAEQFPDHIDKISGWERVIGLAGKRAAPIATFFAADKIPQRRGKKQPDIYEVVEWAKTGPGGDIRQRVMDMDIDIDQCLSAMGACE